MPDDRRVLIFGGTGFLGRHVVAALSGRGYSPCVVARTGGDLTWDGKSTGEWQKAIEGAAAVLNLSGAPVVLKKTPANRELILSSRVESTLTIGRAIGGCSAPPSVWLNASAVGYYGDRADDLLTETSGPGEGFLADTCIQWEEAQTHFKPPGTRQCCLRIGFVLGRDGGGLPPIAALARWGLGGAVGNGQQWMPWIHVHDLVNQMVWLIESGGEGAYNGCAPEPCRNGTFMTVIRRLLRRPWCPPAPAWMIRSLSPYVTPDPSLALPSTRVVPHRAIAEGFDFKFASLEAALMDTL